MPQPVSLQLGPFKGGLVHAGARDLYFVKPDEAQTAGNVELENGALYGAWQPGVAVTTFGDSGNTIFNVANTWKAVGNYCSVLKVGDIVYTADRNTAAQPLVWLNASTSKSLGIVPPVVSLWPADLLAGETEILLGEKVVVTFKRADGTESNASNVLTATWRDKAMKLEYTNPITTNPWSLCQDVVGGRVWRTNGGAGAAGTGKYYLVASFSGPTDLNQPIYLSANHVRIAGISGPAVPDGNISLAWDPGGYPDLGEGSGRNVSLQYIADHSYPPLLTILADKLHSAFHGGDPTAGYMVGANGRWLYWSEPGWLDYFPTRNKVEFADTIIAIVGIPGASVVFTPSGTYQFTLSGRVPSITEFESGYYVRSDAAKSVVWTPDGILYLAREGIARFNGQRSELLSQAYLDSAVLASWAVNAAAYDDGRYLLFLTTGTMVADLRFGLEGLRFSGLNAVYKACWMQAGSLYVLGSYGVSLYKWENGRGLAASSSFSGATPNTGVSITSVTGATAGGVYDLSLITTQSDTGAQTPAWTTPPGITGVALVGVTDGAAVGANTLAINVGGGQAINLNISAFYASAGSWLFRFTPDQANGRLNYDLIEPLWTGLTHSGFLSWPSGSETHDSWGHPEGANSWITIQLAAGTAPISQLPTGTSEVPFDAPGGVVPAAITLQAASPGYTASWGGGDPRPLTWASGTPLTLIGAGNAGNLTINTSGTAPASTISASITVGAVFSLKYQWKWNNTLLPPVTPYSSWDVTPPKTITDPTAGVITFTPGSAAPLYSAAPRVDPITVTLTAADRSWWVWRTPPLNPGTYTRWRRMRVVYQDQVKVRRIGYDGVLTTVFDIKTLQSVTRKDELFWLPPSTPGAWQAFEFIGENYSVTGRVGSLVRCQLYGEQFDGGS